MNKNKKRKLNFKNTQFALKEFNDNLIKIKLNVNPDNYINSLSLKKIFTENKITYYVLKVYHKYDKTKDFECILNKNLIFCKNFEIKNIYLKYCEIKYKNE